MASKFNDITTGQLLPVERKALLESIRRTKDCTSRVYLEIGTWHGKTTEGIVYATAAVRGKATVITIDPTPQDDAYPRIVEASKETQVDARLLVGKSWHIKDQLPTPIAWAFIDGCHCKQCVTRDIDVIAPKIEPGGYIVFHDVHPEAAPPEPGHWWIGVVHAIEKSHILNLTYDLVHEVPPVPSKRPWGYNGGLWVMQRREVPRCLS